MLPGLSIIEANAGHLNDIISLWFELMNYHERISPYFMLRPDADLAFRDFALQHIESGDARIDIARVDGQPAGYCMSRIDVVPPVFVVDRCVILQDMLVSERFRRRGIGRALVDRTVRWARSRNIELIQLYVASGNPEGVAFWESMGFAEVLKVMRRNTWEAAVYESGMDESRRSG